MANKKEFFLATTQRIFSNWTALKMAVEHGMGTKERAVEFCPYITEVVFMNEGINTAEIAEELENYMDEHFNTELQDYSSVQVASELSRFYAYCIQGNENLAIAELEKLPPLQPWIDPCRPLQKRVKTLTTENNLQNDGSSQDVDISEEWTEVKVRRKK